VANNVFDQTILNVRERPLSSDLNQAQSQLYRTIRALLRYQFARQNAVNGVGTVQSGFIGDAFQVYADSPASLTVFVRPGIGFISDVSDVPVDIGGIVGLDDREQYKPLVLSEAQSFAITPDGADPRIDIVEVTYDRRAENPLSRDIFTATSPYNFVATAVNKTLAWIQNGRTSIDGSSKINYKTGTPAPVPVAPSVTAGYTKIGEVYVPAAAASVATLRDTRKIVSPYGRAFARLALSIPDTAIAPTISHFQATPGVRVFVKNFLAGAFTVYILPGGTPTNVTASGMAQSTASALTIHANAPNIGTLSGGEITLLGTTTAPTFSNGFTGADRIAFNCSFGAALVTPATCYLDFSWDYA